MFRIFITFLFLFFNSHKAASTTLIPTPVSEQLKASDGVVYATYQSEVYKKIKDQVITEAIFSVKKSVGVPTHKIVNRNNFKVIFPGGIWNGRQYQTFGAPKFTKGEEVVLILKESGYGTTVKGLTLGKYKIMKDSTGVYLSSTAFPDHFKLGKIKISKFDDELFSRFGERLGVLSSDEQIDKKIFVRSRRATKSSGRTIASVDSDDMEDGSTEGSSSSGLMWPVLLFSLFGAFSMIYSRKVSRKK